MAVLHQVAADDGLPVGARSRGATGARRQQAAAPDGPAHRVLQPDRRARPRPVRRRRRHAARGGHRPRSPARAGDRARAALGGGLRLGRHGSWPASATARVRCWPTSGTADPGGLAAFDPGGLELRVGDALAVLPTIETGSIDHIATDPPYNLQLPMTMAGGPLSVAHANRRTDYAMVTDSPLDLANAADYPAFLDRMEVVFGELLRVLRRGSLRGRHRARRLPGRALPVHRLGPGRAGGGGRLRPEGRPDLVPGRHAACVRTATRAPSSRTSSTSTSWCCARNARVSLAGGATRGRPRRRRCRGRTRPSSTSPAPRASSRPGMSGAGSSSCAVSLRVILWSQPCWPSGLRTSQ